MVIIQCYVGFLEGNVCNSMIIAVLKEAGQKQDLVKSYYRHVIFVALLACYSLNTWPHDD